MQPPIKNIIFDLGGVLLNLDFKKAHDAFILLGIADIKLHIVSGKTGGFFETFETCKTSVTDFTGHIRTLSSQRLEDVDILQAWNAILLDFPSERISFLSQLREKYKLFLFSNTNDIHHDRVQEIYRERFNGAFNDHFDKAYYSCHIGHRKPHVSAFEHVVQDAGITPGETLFIDDLLENIQGAAAAGMRTAHVTADKTILDLDL